MTISFDKKLERIRRGMNNPRFKKEARYSMDVAGQQIGNVMSRFLSAKDYTGQLSDSIEHTVTSSGDKVTIGPTAKRGKWDAGTLLEHGVRGGVNVPFEPIFHWAETKGLQGYSGAIWQKIRRDGIRAYPWVKRVRYSGETQAAIRQASIRIGKRLATNILGKNQEGGN